MRITRTLSLIGCALLIIAAADTSAHAQTPAWTTNGTSLVTNAATGNVGIGTTTPTQKLEVIGNADVSSHFFWGSNNATLRNDQGGSLELGAWDIGPGTRSAGTGTPYIDFHYSGLTEDYNVRLMNSADGMLSLAATTFYTWANLGLNTTNPLARVHINNGALLATGTGGSTPTSGAGTRMMWIPAKSSLRAGLVSGTQWDDANIGTASTAFGNGTIASGSYSTALGSGTTASGIYSFTGGNGSSASYDYGFAFGNGAVSANRYAIAFGEGTRADGWYSFAGGKYSAAYGQYADYGFAFGLSDSVIQSYGVAFGDHNYVFGVASFAAGLNNYALGSYAVAMGGYDSVRDDYGVALGYKNTTNGYGGTTLGGFNTVTEASNYGFAANLGNTSSGLQAATFGYHNLASGGQSFAGGSDNVASGTNATSFGDHNTASGTGATSFGSYTTASGDYSVSMGNHTTAQAYKSLVMGRYNVISGTTNSWVSTEPAFVIGNGTGTGVNASNSLTVYKNGTMHLGSTFYTSDARLKGNLVPVSDALSSIDRIQPIYFTYNNQEVHPAGRQLGFIAQEIEATYPELTMHDEKGYLAVNYAAMSAVAIQAIKEQQQRINAITAEKSDVAEQLAAANARIAEQDARIARIEAMLRQIAPECCPEPADLPVIK